MKLYQVFRLLLVLLLLDALAPSPVCVDVADALLLVACPVSSVSAAEHAARMRADERAKRLTRIDILRSGLGRPPCDRLWS